MPSIFQKIDEFSTRPLRSCAEAGKFLDLDSRSIRRLVQSGDLLAIRYTVNGSYKVLSDSAVCLFLLTVALAWSDGARLPYYQETFTRYLGKFGIPVSVFGNWRSVNGSIKWSEKAETVMDPAELKAYRESMEAARKLREAALQEAWILARTKAQNLWKKAKPATDNHPYLKAKGVKAYGLRVQDGRLVVP